MLNAVLSVPVVTLLLHCDAQLYGGVLRACFAPGFCVDTYLRGHTLTFSAPRHLRRVVERNLYPVCVSGPVERDVTAAFDLCAYRVRHGSGHIKILVSYASDHRSGTGPVGTRPDVDVNTLQVGRLGLGIRTVPPSLAMHPSPLQHIIAGCAARRFRVVDEPATEDDENFLLRRMRSLVARGWTHGGERVARAEPVPDVDCPICLGSHNPDAPEDWVALQPCGHLFHRRCLGAYVREHVRRQAVYPRTTRCAMCRASVRLYELVPGLDTPPPAITG